MNTTLIMNASEGRIQFVLEQEGSLACAQEWSAPSKGTELLTPALADAFQRLGIMPSDISRIACVAGRELTGLRLALTTAAAFRRATGAAVAPLNALQALAGSVPFGLLFPARETRIRVITHARRGLVHGQDFLCAPGSALPSPVDEPAMWEIPAACGGERPDIMLGSGVARNLPQLEELFGDSAPLFLPALTHPTAQALLDLALALPDGAWGHKDLDPLYLAPATPWTISPPSPPSAVRLPKRPMQLDKLLRPSAEKSYGKQMKIGR
ncbi:MAG: tRNA (adenosine(37)-N6)-threonylcarbamoyltransferase complex dimerization subunit type 1 TsaB [Bilophila wadsworthia]